MSSDSIRITEVIVILSGHLDHDGKMRAAAQLRDHAAKQDKSYDAEFFEHMADSLERYADEKAGGLTQ